MGKVQFLLSSIDVHLLMPFVTSAISDQHTLVSFSTIRHLVDETWSLLLANFRPYTCRLHVHNASNSFVFKNFLVGGRTPKPPTWKCISHLVFGTTLSELFVHKADIVYALQDLTCIACANSGLHVHVWTFHQIHSRFLGGRIPKPLARRCLSRQSFFTPLFQKFLCTKLIMDMLCI